MLNLGTILMAGAATFSGAKVGRHAGRMMQETQKGDTNKSAKHALAAMLWTVPFVISTMGLIKQYKEYQWVKSQDQEPTVKETPHVAKATPKSIHVINFQKTR